MLSARLRSIRIIAWGGASASCSTASPRPRTLRKVDFPVLRAPKMATLVCALSVRATSRAKSSIPTIFVGSSSGRFQTNGLSAMVEV